MRRFRSLLAALQLALLTTIQLAEGTGVHHCPEHDAGVGAGAPSEMAPHMGHHTGASPKEHGGCHCIGVCCQATPAYPAPAPVGAALAMEPAPPSLPLVVTTLRGSVRLLPFAIGPPLLA
jgi:hypothetical protein